MTGGNARICRIEGVACTHAYALIDMFTRNLESRPEAATIGNSASSFVSRAHLPSRIARQPTSVLNQRRVDSVCGGRSVRELYRRRWLRHFSELPHKAKHVLFGRHLRDSPVPDAQDVSRRPADPLPRRCNAHQRPKMRCLTPPTTGHLVAVRNELFDRDPPVGEGRPPML
jgi:hypothetical protein